MLLLRGTGPLETAADIQSALHSGIRSLLTLSSEPAQVEVNGELPRLNWIRLDLTGTSIEASNLSQGTGRKASQDGSMAASRLTVLARRLQVGGVTIAEVALDARDAGLDLITDTAGNRWLRLMDAAEGEFSLDLGAGEPDRLLREALSVAAAKYGAELKEGQLRLAQAGVTSVSFQMEATGRKAFVRGTVQVDGRLELDEELHARLSDVRCSGRGILGIALAAWLQSSAKKWEGERIPLLGHSFGVVKCHHLRLNVGEGDALRVVGAFGRQKSAAVS